jgi:hypothetical protein
MDDPTRVLGRTQHRIGAARKERAVVTAMRRYACMLVLILLFLAVGVGGVPDYGTAPQEAASLKLFPLDHGWTLEAGVDPASADTLSDADQETDSYEGRLSTRARFKTH